MFLFILAQDVKGLKSLCSFLFLIFFFIICFMKVVLKLFATLRDFGPKYQELELVEGSTLKDLISSHNIPLDMPMIRLVNGEFAELSYQLKEGDVVALFPPIAGG